MAAGCQQLHGRGAPVLAASPRPLAPAPTWFALSSHAPGPPCSASEDQWLLYDGMRAQLLDPEFANDTVHFMELQVGCRLGCLLRMVDAQRVAAAGAAAPSGSPSLFLMFRVQLSDFRTK